MKKYQILIASLLIVPFLTIGQQVGEMTMDMKEGEKIHKKRGYSPYAGRYFPTQVFWGDTHLHTSNSLDARAFGTVLGPEEAYRLARGEEITATHGEKVKLSRPLDWLVVADHSDGMGAMNEIIKGDPNLMSDATVKDWHQRINQGGNEALMATMDVINSFALGKIPEVLIDEDFAQTVWDRYIKTAEKYNEPGRFTTIIGYEWTSTEDGNNLHRNVLYRDNGDLARQMLPYTTTESFNPEDLWQWMEQYETKTKGNVLALAHNGNLSNGIMFPVEVNPATGKPLDENYMKDRIKWEPLYEITQIKGDGEAHPLLSPNDEFADYENWEKGNLNLSTAKTDDMLQYEYAREALKNGLKMEAKFGTNPYKFGVVGSTDSHTSLATAEEDNFFGKHSGNEPSAHRSKGIVGEFEGNKIFDWELVASGYAGVWATENTREAIFDAMARKEVYATTGPRILVRFFGGWDFESGDAKNRLPAEIGYSKGVPMGGDLYSAPKGKSPTFLVGALKDPYGGNLDRIQIVKGWLDKSGKTHEKVYDVVWSDMDQRKADKDGKIPDVGNTVDVANATWSNTIGRAELISVWKDPDFDPKQSAFYYARVIEIPTPRWTAYDAKRFGVEMPKESPMTTTERAYTSPIWYTP
ncbi:DUF3604 domain-containing protein [Lutimonas zeaxanthinifaciens]|uniref:DUF3604 domain-containing protein n=1 Tax=Lutimonas zeaxanthinifaciens TaxID=3060215 RepID=UPI00265CD46D|nr:DUF3604 domain-containing protein [Lutimonas sp. YSD2104]WKK67429.1 DUF3604 domain-containing protein [Lutimonas sp. YSD2104]